MKNFIVLLSLFIILVCSYISYAGTCICSNMSGEGLRECKNGFEECGKYCKAQYGSQLGNVNYVSGKCGIKGKTFEVSARPSGPKQYHEYWNEPGIKIPRGATVTITYLSGTWRSNPHWGATDGNGNSKFLASHQYILPGYPEGCLVGVLDPGKPFYIGNGTTIVSDHPSNLLLTVNDEMSGFAFGDNNDSIIVKIQVYQE